MIVIFKQWEQDLHCQDIIRVIKTQEDRFVWGVGFMLDIVWTTPKNDSRNYDKRVIYKREDIDLVGKFNWDSYNKNKNQEWIAETECEIRVDKYEKDIRTMAETL